MKSTVHVCVCVSVGMARVQNGTCLITHSLTHPLLPTFAVGNVTRCEKTRLDGWFGPIKILKIDSSLHFPIFNVNVFKQIKLGFIVTVTFLNHFFHFLPLPSNFFN